MINRLSNIELAILGFAVAFVVVFGLLLAVDP